MPGVAWTLRPGSAGFSTWPGERTWGTRAGGPGRAARLDKAARDEGAQILVEGASGKPEREDVERGDNGVMVTPRGAPLAPYAPGSALSSVFATQTHTITHTRTHARTRTKTSTHECQRRARSRGARRRGEQSLAPGAKPLEPRWLKEETSCHSLVPMATSSSSELRRAMPRAAPPWPPEWPEVAEGAGGNLRLGLAPTYLLIMPQHFYAADHPHLSLEERSSLVCFLLSLCFS